jgi:hypothetical protein
MPRVADGACAPIGTVLPVPFRLLRSLQGLPVGAAFVIDRRLVIGRAVDCDVQLVDASVSRHHAKIELDADGNAVLVDLSSRAGTRVDGITVDRIVLTHGATISIVGFRLRYEESEAPVRERRTRRVAGMDALRVTSSFEPPRMDRRAGMPSRGPRTPRREPEPPGAMTSVVDPPEPPSHVSRSAQTLRPGFTAAVGDAQVPLPEVEVATVVSPLIELGTSPIDVGLPTVVPATPIVISLPGDAQAALVRAVVTLRGHESPSTGPDAQLLSTEPPPGRRRHPRFRCTMRGWLARRDAERISTRAIAMRDLAFGGACIEWTDDATQLDPKMWLVLDIEDDSAPMVVLPSRLVWASPASRTAGLAFVGPAGTGLDALELIRMS